MSGHHERRVAMGGTLVVSDRPLLPPAPGDVPPSGATGATAATGAACGEVSSPDVLPVVRVTHEVVVALPDAPGFDGTPAFHPVDAGWRCIVPGVASLGITAAVPADGGGFDAVVVRELAGADPALVDHLVVDHAIPRLLAARGAVVLHATCVTAGDAVGDDVAVAFLGPTGAGKSTLAAAFLARGSRLVADDCLAVRTEDDAVVALPSVPYTRLLPDTAVRLAGARPGDGPRRAGKHLTSVAAAPGPTTLAAAFVVARDADPAPASPGGEPAGTDAVAVEPVPPAAAMWELASQSFNAMLLGTPPAAAALRSLVGRLRPVAERLPVFRLRYRSGYEDLDGVLDAVLDAVRTVRRRPTGGMTY